jgi:hypothetical protein
MEVSGWHYAPAVLPPGKNRGIHWDGARVGTRVCLDVSNKKQISYSCQVSNPGPSSPNSSRCPGSSKTCTNISKAVIILNTSFSYVHRIWTEKWVTVCLCRAVSSATGGSELHARASLTPISESGSDTRWLGQFHPVTSQHHVSDTF